MNQTNRRDPWNILLLLGSILALLISFIGATGTILLGVVGFFVGGSISNNAAWVLAGTFIGLAFISLPSGWVAIQALQGNAQEVRKPSPRTIQIILMMFPFVLLLGTLAFQEEILPSFLGPPTSLRHSCPS